MKKIKAKNISVESEQDLSVKVKIESKAQIGDTIDQLISMDDWEFKETVKCAKLYRKANKKLQDALDIQADTMELSYVGQ